jgi:hypothetical protein
MTILYPVVSDIWLFCSITTSYRGPLGSKVNVSSGRSVRNSFGVEKLH